MLSTLLTAFAAPAVDWPSATRHRADRSAWRSTDWCSTTYSELSQFPTKERALQELEQSPTAVRRRLRVGDYPTLDSHSTWFLANRPDGIGVMYFLREFGAPFRCFYCTEVSLEWGGRGNPPLKRHGVVLVPSTTLGSGWLIGVLPRVHLLLANVVVHAVVWGGVAVVVRRTRERWRLRRGLCPRCAYDVKGGAACPECGWGIERREATGERRQ